MHLKLRSQSVPRKRNVNLESEQKETKEKKEVRKHKSLTFKERLRSTFIRSYRKDELKIKEEIVYGKVVLFGDQAVGKTSIIHRLSNNYYTANYTPTTSTTIFNVSAIIECEPERTKDLLKKKKNRKASISETPSTNCRCHPVERVLSVSQSESLMRIPRASKGAHLKEFKFQLIDSVYDVNLSSPITYRATISDAHGFILVCSYDKPESISYIQNIYGEIKELRQNYDAPILLIVNKLDKKTTPSTDGDEFDRNLKVFLEVNQLKSANISTENDEGFESLTELMLQEMNAFEEKESKENSVPDYYAFIDEEKRHPEVFKQWKVIM